jgi:hypothetical protein
MVCTLIITRTTQYSDYAVGYLSFKTNEATVNRENADGIRPATIRRLDQPIIFLVRFVRNLHGGQYGYSCWCLVVTCGVGLSRFQLKRSFNQRTKSRLQEIKNFRGQVLKGRTVCK